ncbi:MAG: FMN-binding protein [Gammaproteobacteria bacterium]|nr:FMN-binding protein [Gammaproteobacteria bacterium]
MAVLSEHISLPALLAGFFCLVGMASHSHAEQYMSEQEFLAKHFSSTPATKALWITGDLKTLTSNVLQHPPQKLRQRYWQDQQRSLWVMEEIGKEKPITVGIVVNDGALEEVKVLAYRESRGWEVKYPFFTEQFDAAQLSTEKNPTQLDKNIDNITGATLSVRAVTKLARLALLYHQHITKDTQ